MKNWYSIGDFSKKTHLSIKALRFYEEKKLLLPHRRDENHYRYYSEEQVPVADLIKKYKDLGFSLEEISVLLNHQSTSLQELLNRKLLAIESSQQTLSHQKEAIISILTSLNTGLELSNTQRSFIMENLFAISLEGLKRKGLIPSEEVHQQLTNEVTHFSSKQERVIGAVRTIIQRARNLNVLLGPGRGSSPASLVLFSEGYSPLNPQKFNLIPELFTGSNDLWLDVEFSRSQEIGDLCKRLTEELDYPIVAFKCPFLDILHRMQKQIGRIDFDNFADDSETVMSAFQKKNLRGLWGFEWSPHFTAFQRLSKEIQKKLFREQNKFEDWMQIYQLSDIEDLLNISYLHQEKGLEGLELYKSLKDSKIHYPFLKQSSQQLLSKTHGLLLYREDWLRLLCDNGPFDIMEAISIFKALRKDQTTSPEYANFMSLEKKEVRDLLSKR